MTQDWQPTEEGGIARKTVEEVGLRCFVDHVPRDAWFIPSGRSRPYVTMHDGRCRHFW